MHKTLMQNSALYGLSDFENLSSIFPVFSLLVLQSGLLGGRELEGADLEGADVWSLAGVRAADLGVHPFLHLVQSHRETTEKKSGLESICYLSTDM